MSFDEADPAMPELHEILRHFICGVPVVHVHVRAAIEVLCGSDPHIGNALCFKRIEHLGSVADRRGEK